MARKVIEPNSALDWMTLREVCEGAARDLMRANPNDPKLGRIDLYRQVKIDGQNCVVRVKLTIAHPTIPALLRGTTV